MRETASRLGVHENTVRNWVKQGMLRSARVAGSRSHRFEIEEVERLVRSRGAAVAPVQEARRTVGPELADATQLHAWSERLESKALLPKLVRRLLAATPGLQELSMRAGEGIGAEGWDGLVDTEQAHPPVPAGVSAWELGTGAYPRAKAQEEYDKRTADPQGVDPAQTTLVFVTSRRWPSAAKWENERRADEIWRDVRVVDADGIETWLEATPAVHYWISEQMGLHPRDAETVELWWRRFADRTQPPVPAAVVLAGRQAARDKLREFLAGDPGVIGVEGGWRDEALAFVAASVEADTPADVPAGKPVIIVATRDVFAGLSRSHTPLVLVATFDEPDIAAAIRGGHHVVVPIGKGDVGQGVLIQLLRVDRDQAREALVEAGLSFERADELAALARRSMASLVRVLSPNPRLARPSWGQPPLSDLFAPLMLVGGWSPSEADHGVVAEVVGRAWPDVERALSASLRTEDPPFTRSGGQWHLTSPEEAFAVLGGLLTTGDFERWQEAVLRVLAEADPRADLSADERLLAGMRGQRRTYSDVLRRGLAESVALLGVLGEQPYENGLTASERARKVVRTLLERANSDASGVLWRSLSMELPRLAEAAPQEFLDAVEGGLSGDSPLLATMFRDSKSGSWLHTSSPHTGLLWALEVMCWSPQYLPGALNVLGRLAEVDPGGKLANRPAASLRAVLLPWVPYTGAPLERRLEAVRQLRRRYPRVGWRLLLSLLPRPHDTSSPTSSPRFREWKPDRQGVLVSEWAANIAGLIDQAIEGAADDPRRWADVVGHLGSLDREHRTRLLDELDRLAGSELADDEGRLILWERLTTEAGRHRSFPQADWSMDEESLTRMEDLAARLEPAESVERHAGLFDWRPHMPGIDPFDHAATEQALQQARTKAIRDTVKRAGGDGLIRLATRCVRRDQVGWVAADVAGDDFMDAMFGWLDSDGVPGAVASGWVRRMALLDESWTAAQTERFKHLAAYAQARFLLAIPIDGSLWPLLEEASPDAAEKFWQSAQAWSFLPQDLERAVDAFLTHKRPWAAIDLLTAYARKEDETPPGMTIALVEKALLAGLSAESRDEARSGSLGYEIGVVLDFLEEHGCEEAVLVRLEFAYFPAIEHHREPRALYATLARDPSLFVDLVSRVYRGKKERKRQLDEESTALARGAWSVLNGWRRVPGTDDSGNLDGAQLRAWVRQARLSLAERDRTDIGDEQIGQLLSAAPAGSDGAWPAEPVRELVEEIGSRDLENGLHVGVVSGRGITSRDPYEGGKQERVLATRYREWADAIASWDRTARILGSLAEFYEREAKREDAEAEWSADS